MMKHINKVLTDIYTESYTSPINIVNNVSKRYSTIFIEKGIFDPFEIPRNYGRVVNELPQLSYPRSMIKLIIDKEGMRNFNPDLPINYLKLINEIIEVRYMKEEIFSLKNKRKVYRVGSLITKRLDRLLCGATIPLVITRRVDHSYE